MIERIDHVSLAVRDINKAGEFFSSILGLIPCTWSAMEDMKYLGKVFAAGDLSRIEMITPTGAGSFLDKFLAEREGIHHICFQTRDIEAAKSRLEEKKIPFFGYSAEGDWKEIFIHPRDAFGILIQIAEFKPEEFLVEPLRFPQGIKWEISSDVSCICLTTAHPGGGKSRLELTHAEARRLGEELMKAGN
ncbi:MAG: VOC family protein [Syntrophorhabdaceae bacterium]